MMYGDIPTEVQQVSYRVLEQFATEYQVYLSTTKLSQQPQISVMYTDELYKVSSNSHIINQVVYHRS